jgi:hypothetical protein
MASVLLAYGLLVVDLVWLRCRVRSDSDERNDADEP